MQQLLLGVDVGTTATKAVLVDNAGHIISQGRAEYSTKYLQAGWVEQDPNDWWLSFCKAVSRPDEVASMINFLTSDASY